MTSTMQEQGNVAAAVVANVVVAVLIGVGVVLVAAVVVVGKCPRSDLALLVCGGAGGEVEDA